MKSKGAIARARASVGENLSCVLGWYAMECAGRIFPLLVAVEVSLQYVPRPYPHSAYLKLIFTEGGLDFEAFFSDEMFPFSVRPHW